MNEPTTGQKLEALARKLGLSERIGEARFLQERERWISDAQAWLEDFAERRAIQAESEAAEARGRCTLKSSRRIFRRLPA